MPSASRRVARLAWVTLVVNLFVILWGAWVRASGSGAGCGNHWPTCNGVIIPQSPTMHTIVEFTHRVSSGLALILVVLLAVATWRTFAPRHPARITAALAVLFIVLEAAIGAGLVKLALVAENASLGRALFLGVHLINTQFLLSTIALTGWWASGHPGMGQDELRQHRLGIIVTFGALILVGMAGAAASLGDTLFPARTLAEGIAQDRSSTVNLLLHIRVWHPVLALATGLWAIGWAAALHAGSGNPSLKRRGRTLIVTVLGQWTVGALTLVLLAPIALQLLHLVMADLVWLAAVGVAVTAAADYSGRTARAMADTAAGSKADGSER